MSNVIEQAKSRIKGQKLKLVMPEGDDARIEAAARQVLGVTETLFSG